MTDILWGVRRFCKRKGDIESNGEFDKEKRRGELKVYFRSISKIVGVTAHQEIMTYRFFSHLKVSLNQ